MLKSLPVPKLIVSPEHLLFPIAEINPSTVSETCKSLLGVREPNLIYFYLIK